MQTGQNQAAAPQTVTAEISVDLGSTNSQIAVKITGDNDGEILAGRTTAKKGKTVKDFLIRDGLSINFPTKYIRRDEWPEEALFDWGNEKIYFGSKAVEAYNSTYGGNRGVLRGEFKSDLYFSMEDKEDPDIRKRYERACESTKLFLKYLCTHAEEEISVYSGRISKRITYVTVPNRSSNEDKKKMKELAKSAGFQNVQIVEEAESALRYVIADSGSALRKAFESMKEIKPLYVILMDIGGSTADLLTVKLVPSPDRPEGYEIHILGMWPETGEKDTLGGMDVDRAIKDYMVKKGYLLSGIVEESIKWRGYLEFEKFKKWINLKLLKGESIEDLYNLEAYAIDFDNREFASVSYKKLDSSDKIDYQNFINGIAGEYLKKLRSALKNLLKDSYDPEKDKTGTSADGRTGNIDPQEIDFVVAVGGGSKLAGIRDMIRGDYWNGEPNLLELKKIQENENAYIEEPSEYSSAVCVMGNLEKMEPVRKYSNGTYRLRVDIYLENALNQEQADKIAKWEGTGPVPEGLKRILQMKIPLVENRQMLPVKLVRKSSAEIGSGSGHNFIQFIRVYREKDGKSYTEEKKKITSWRGPFKFLSHTLFGSSLKGEKVELEADCSISEQRIVKLSLKTKLPAGFHGIGSQTVDL